MIADPLLRWVATLLFALSGIEYTFALCTQRRPWHWAVSNALHVAMAIAMVAMAWPWGVRLPTTGPALFFVLGSGWFATMAVVSAHTFAQRAVCVYHFLMMLAMAWMYAVMNGHMLPGGSGIRHPMGSGMPMTGGGSPGWINTVNWLWFTGCAAAAAFWAYTSARDRSRGWSGWWHNAPAHAGRAAMAAGMAMMFVALLFRI